MIAKYLTKNNREYASNVFAIFDEGWKTSAIIFDDENNKFEHVEMFVSNVRKLFVIDKKASSWTTKDKIKIGLLSSLKNARGVDWIINDNELLLKIVKNKPVEDKFIQLAKAENEKILLKDWHEVENKEEIDNLLNLAFDFHDATISKMDFSLSSGLLVEFKDCWNCVIKLRFGDGVQINYNQEELSNSIFDSSIFFENGYIYWVNEDGVDSTLRFKDNSVFIRGKRLEWKMIIDKPNK